jgi:hypothetical protein
VPFGGTKCSGVGREGGEHSLEFFTETKSLALAEPACIPPMPSKMPSVPAGASLALRPYVSPDSLAHSLWPFPVMILPVR